MYASGYTARPDVSLVGVMSGIEMACWDIVGKAVEQARLRAPRRAGARAPAGVHVPLHRGRTTGRRLPRSRRSPPNGPPAYAARGLHGAEVRPCRRLLGVRPPPARARGARVARRPTSGPFARPSAPAATCSSARTGSSRPPARSASPDGSRSSTRSGSRSPSHPSSPRRWRRSRARRRSRSRPASG